MSKFSFLPVLIWWSSIPLLYHSSYGYSFHFGRRINHENRGHQRRICSAHLFPFLVHRDQSFVIKTKTVLNLSRAHQYILESCNMQIILGPPRTSETPIFIADENQPIKLAIWFPHASNEFFLSFQVSRMIIFLILHTWKNKSPKIPCDSHRSISGGDNGIGLNWYHQACQFLSIYSKRSKSEAFGWLPFSIPNSLSIGEQPLHIDLHQITKPWTSQQLTCLSSLIESVNASASSGSEDWLLENCRLVQLAPFTNINMCVRFQGRWAFYRCTMK